MGQVVHTSRSRIVREKGPHRIAQIEGLNGDVHYGVHGGIANFYKDQVPPGEEQPATLDHIVSAVASWMLGTLARILASKGIDTPAEHYWADVEGDIEDVDGVLKITQIRVNYNLAVPQGKSPAAQECLATYIKFCPAAQSVIGCIDIKDHADISELAE